MTDTASAAPSDVDIDATWDALPGIRIHNDADARGLNTQTMLRRAFARAVLAKWGQPTPPSAAPSERERFERHVKAYTGRDMAYHERNGTTGLEFGWTCWQAARAQPTPPAADQEPFGYFRAEPFGWTDCAETDEGAVALYEHPTPPAVVEPMTDGLLQQHNRDSQELRRLCAARDQARSERDALKAEIAGLEASCSTLGRLVDELRADSERLEWVLRRCAGSWLRYYLGVVSDTCDMDTLRMLIDANRGALAAHGIKKENGNG